VDDVDRSREDAWFREHEKELLEAAKAAREKRERERVAKEQSEERERLQRLHHMKCPKCGHDLKPEQMHGIEIDRCGFCEGFFIDAGEMEQLFLGHSASERRGFTRWLLRI
jgi:Transcription factor zinc-finger